jgi:formate dehydrogenase iron-sulfur subunit
MTLRIFIPRDAGAVAVGADEVALELTELAQARGIGIDLVRPGSRGL